MAARKRDRSRAFRAVREAVLDRQPLCVLCLAEGRTVAAVEVDHVIPLSEGGGDDPENLRPLCAECHRRVTAGQSARRRGKLGHDDRGYPLVRLR